MTSFKVLRLPQLKALLQHIEPSTFTDANIRIILAKGTRGEKEKTLLSFLEFVTNITTETGIPKDMRTPGQLKQMVAEAAIAHGRRALGLVLPTDWQKQGVYEHTITEGRLTLRNHSEYSAVIHQVGGFFRQPCALMLAQSESQARAAKHIEDAPPEPLVEPVVEEDKKSVKRKPGVEAQSKAAPKRKTNK
eukprot:4315776-Amphidinium_carterae.1